MRQSKAAALPEPDHVQPGRIGTLNHIRLTVTDIPRAEAFYDPLLGFMGYRLVEQPAFSVGRLDTIRYATVVYPECSQARGVKSPRPLRSRISSHGLEC